MACQCSRRLATRDVGATVSWYTGGLDFIEFEQA
jgi:hypothetical protein